jgi:hypothetical protein
MTDGTWDFDPARRAALADRVLTALRADRHVIAAALFGSLASREPDGYPADRYSDIDIGVQVQGMPARTFFRALPTVVAPVGAVLLWDADVEADRYIAHVWFVGYPLCWAVDIACLSPEPTDLTAAGELSAWPPGFGLWVLTLKRLLRVQDALALLDAAVGTPPDDHPLAQTAAAALLARLDAWRARVAPSLPAEQPHALAVDVVQRLLTEPHASPSFA